MTELEKRLKHIEKTNAKRTDDYIKYQRQAEKNFNIIRDREQSKYLNPNLEKETKKATNSNVTLQDTNFNNYKTVKNTVDNYVSQRNRNDENVRVFTPERNQAKSNQIVNSIYGTAGQQAEEDEYNATIDSLNKRKTDLQVKLSKYNDAGQTTEKGQTLLEQLDYVDNQIKETENQYKDKLYQRDKRIIYANNGGVTNTLQDYTFVTEGAKMKGSTASYEENAKLDEQRKKVEVANKNEIDEYEKDLQMQKDNIQNQIDEVNEELRYIHLDGDNTEEYYSNLEKWQNAVNERDTLQVELEELESSESRVYRKLKRGAELATENIEDTEEARLAIRLGIEETDEDDENFEHLLTQYVREEDRIRYYYIKGMYGNTAAESYALYAVQQANTAEGLEKAYKNNTLEEFHNSASNGLLGFFEGWWDAADAVVSKIAGDEGVLKSDYTRIDSASDVTLRKDKEQAGKVKSFLLDVTNVTANQLPSIALTMVTSGAAGELGASASVASTAGKTVGMVSQSVSAAGNAYSQALVEGNSADEALLYGGIQGLTEFATEKVLGGQFGMNGALEKYGSKALKNVIPKLVANETFATYAYQAGKILINSAGEFNEEAIQQLLEPYIRNISFGENNEQTLQNVEDALYNGFLGMASAGLTNTTGEVTSGVVNGVANKISNAKSPKTKGYEIISNLNPEHQALNKTNQNTIQSENIESPTVEAVISEAETNQKTAKRLTKIIEKIDNGETVTDSEISELKYNETASDMLGQMAGLKENKITSDLDNDAVRAVINEAQNGKKNIDTTSILSNIRNNLNTTQNITENANENNASSVSNVNEGNLTNTNQRTSQDIAEASMPSQLSEVSEAVPKNIAENHEGNYTSNIEANNLTANQETSALNDSSYIENVLNNANAVNKVENNSNKILQLGISNEKTGSANIRKVESVDNGVAQLLMTNGEVVSADTLDFSDNKNAEIILTNSGKYNSSTANTFIANYDSSTSTAQEYSTAFNSVYKMAETGASSETIASRAAGARTVLGEKTFNAAIRAGRNTAKGVFSDGTSSKSKNTAIITNNKNSASQNRADNTLKTKKTDKVIELGLKNRNKLVTSSANNNVSQKSKTVNKSDVKKSAKELSKALGVKINVYKNDSDIRGYEKNGEIFINESWVNKKANSASGFNFILAHELTHTLEESKHYNELKEFILNSRVYDDSLKLKDTTHTEEVRSRQELYEKYGKKLTKEQAERELIADFIADELLTNEESIKELAYKDKKLFVKVKEFVNKMIETLKRFVKNSSDITKAQKDLIHIKQLYKKAFDDVKKNGTYSNEIKYSKKLGGYNPEINVTTDNVLKEYGIQNINNITQLITKVSSKLSKSYLSTDKIHKPITNIDTGLKIEIRKSGIRETFGKPSYYRNLSENLQFAKIASMSELAKMIKYGEVRAKDASNYHDPKSKVKFSYLKSSINIDGVNYDVTMDIKRLPNNDNIFYIHALKIKKQETNSIPVRRTANALKENLPLANNNISQKNDIVNNSLRKNSDNDTKTESQKELREFVIEHYDVLKKAYDIMEKFNALENKQNDGENDVNSVDKQGESGIIKSITVDDFELRSYGKGINQDVLDKVFSEIKQIEQESKLIFSDVFFDSLGGSEAGTFALQTEMLTNGLLRININTDVFSGHTFKEINQRFAKTDSILANDFHEAMIHERGHAKSMKGLSPSDVEKMHDELSNIHLSGVSKCAYEDGAECLAEAEVMISRGEKVPEDVMKLYRKYVLRE